MFMAIMNSSCNDCMLCENKCFFINIFVKASFCTINIILFMICLSIHITHAFSLLTEHSSLWLTTPKE